MLQKRVPLIATLDANSAEIRPFPAIDVSAQMQLMIFATGNLVLAIAVFLISCSLTVSIYSKQDC